MKRKTRAQLLDLMRRLSDAWEDWSQADGWDNPEWDDMLDIGVEIDGVLRGEGIPIKRDAKEAG